MEINTQMSPKDRNELGFRADAFNAKIKEDNKGVVSKNALEEADFLKLVITQLKTQDPTNPMNDKEFIGQMTQFTNMKQMSKMSENMGVLAKEVGFTKALAMVNKNVTFSDANGNTSFGVVQSIKVKNGEAYLNIDGNEIPMSRLEEIGMAQNPAQSAAANPAQNAVFNPAPSAQGNPAQDSNAPVKVLDENSPELLEMESESK